MKDDLKINMCRYAGSLCRKVTLNAQIVPKKGKNRPLHLEIFNDWLSKSNHTKKESQVILQRKNIEKKYMKQQKDIQQKKLKSKMSFKLQETKGTKRRILKYLINKKRKQAGRW